MDNSAAPRSVCPRCRRAASACWCRFIEPVQSRTRICLLQHPRERDVAIGTARMAHLSLPNSELHLGVDFEAHARVREVAAQEGTMLLFPSESARGPEELASPPKTVVVVDGTWSQARKVLQRNPRLLALPRIGLRPRKPGNYRIRKEPAPHCVSTIEAIVELLKSLEPEPHAFDPLLRSFDRMVDLQLERTARNPQPSRYMRARGPRRPDAELLRLRARRDDVVLLHAEANSHPAGSDVPGPAELVHLVALRPSTGERFEALLAPRRPLARATPLHLGLSEEAILGGEPAPRALARFADFSRERDLFCSWGRYPLDLLDAERGGASEAVDLKGLAVRTLRRSPGGLEALPAALGQPGPLAPLGQGRAGGRLAALAASFALLLR